MTAPPQISLADLPNETIAHMDFLDSTWFKAHGQARQLPTPEYIQSFSKPNQIPRPMIFEELGLFVKHGPQISISEAINLWTVGRYFRDRVAAPELYGWRIVEKDGKPREVFIYMELCKGPTLEQQWPMMSNTDREAICSELRTMIFSFRTLQDKEPQQVIGSISHGTIPERWLEGFPSMKPFPNRKTFHDYGSLLWRQDFPDPHSIEDPWRKLLPDNEPIVFAHGNLRPFNIIVTATSPARVVAIIDWEQSGWYPDYWDYIKAIYPAPFTQEWRDWVPKLLDPYPGPLEAIRFYRSAFWGFVAKDI